MGQHLGRGEDSESLSAGQLDVLADIAGSFTYASFQNAIPVIRSIELINASGENFESCTLNLTSNPPFLRPKTWTIDRVIAGDRLRIGDRRVELDAGYLAGLNEAERGEITLGFHARSTGLVHERRIPVRLLARDEWGGTDDMAQLLPAFIMPNDPAIAGLLRAAADRLAAHGHPSGLDGYQSRDPARAYMLAAALYSAVAGLGLHYAEPPASFEHRGQKIRRPTTIATDKLATCLDTTLLFAAALEAAGLHPVVLLFQGHAAVGAWLIDKTLGNAHETDAMEIRKALASRELVLLETTGVTHRPPMTFEASRQHVAHRFEEEEIASFVAAIDVKRSRSGGITPLASHSVLTENVDQDGEAPAVLPLPASPLMPVMPAEIAEVKPTTAAGRIDRWQKKLLDLTLRNRLLNFPDSQKTVPFLCTDAGYLEDRLAQGVAVRLISLPEQNPLGERDAALFREVHGRDLQRNFAADALQRDELSSPLDQKQLEGRLIDLHRQVRNDFAEGGTNTLFLAVGFLRWKKKPQDERSYRAPLLLVPVKLERRSASSRFSLRYHEDEPRFNATLLQFLENDFDLRLPQFSGDLPSDENGIDVPLVLSLMRQAVRDVPGMEVLDETALSTFSFAKFLMWKDLVERTDALRENRVVRHLIDTPERPFEGGAAPFLDERQLDRHYSPADIVSLLPADSSQIAASLAAAEGRDFVIVGPPGTGKSQTIANMIANCLAAGKTVLFVAEKTAALDVVYRRLREHGLGDHCIELHSNKADRRSFVGQLKASWESRSRSGAEDWISINDRLRLRRDELNAYVDALHRNYPNGLTAYGAMGLALRHKADHAPEMSWSQPDAHDRPARLELETLAGEIGLAFQSIEMRPALHLVDFADWTSGWQDALLDAAREVRSAAGIVSNASDAFEAGMGLAVRGDSSPETLSSLCNLAETLQQTAGHALAVVFDQDFPKLRGFLAELGRAVSAYREASAKLSARYDPSAIAQIDADGLLQELRRASTAFWPASQIGRRKVLKSLQSYVLDGVADPEHDLPLLSIIKTCAEAAENNGLSGKLADFRGLDTELGEVEHKLQLGDQVRRVLPLKGCSADETRTVIRAIAPGLVSGDGEDRVRQLARRLLAATAGLAAATRSFSECAGRPLQTSDKATQLPDLRSDMEQLIAAGHLLRDWSSWCRVRQRGIARGLGPLVQDLEARLIVPTETGHAFRLSYARWWLPQILDRDPVLRDFRRFQHENALADFHEIDDLVRAQASQRVASAIAHDLPDIQSVPRNSELGLLRHQMELQRPSRSIREMIGAMPASFASLAPCMLMSPLSIAQYMPPNKALFDVVIFDEASQITTWDAVGAIARARQTIIVGDPKQLPPTNFFGRNEEDDEVLEHEKDLESILDEAKAAGIPIRDLRWHYRSRNESLIAFSNHHYYRNRLITFPSPSVEDQAVQLRRVNGVYDRGKSRTNRMEAQAVADEAVGRMRRWLELDEKKRPTLGVITFNAQQQSLILDLLDAARQEDQRLEWFFAEDRIEPVIVKNLENVQGDERDVILFSITFSADAAGKRTMDFGALNREGGERRLNVAVTRARQEMIVFSGFTADQIDPGRTKATGVHHLKAFLDFADRGPIALPGQDEGSVGGFDSPFEEAVADELAKRGWTIVPQVGISGFRIDLGVRHPDFAGAYLAGVECDGATYHSAATARDRDKVREQVLRGLGWEIVRIWSTDWWFDAAGCAERLHGKLADLLEASRAKQMEQSEPEELSNWNMGSEIEADLAVSAPDQGDMQIEATDASMPAEVEQLIPVRPAERRDPSPAEQREYYVATAMTEPAASAARRPHYRLADLSSFAVDPDKFYDFNYRLVLKAMVEAIIDAEAPLRDDILAQRVARAHGWLRTGSKIRERVELYLRDVDRTSESSGTFVWKKGTVVNLLDYRAPFDLAGRRAVADISLAELAAFVLAERDVLDQPDPALDVARLLGLERLAASSRTRLEEAIDRARAHLAS